jgi:CheY-like chemotaxis protein
MLTPSRMLRLEEVYDVTVVKDGQEAYDTVKANMEEGKVFDLIFMDIQVNATSLCRRGEADTDRCPTSTA